MSESTDFSLYGGAESVGPCEKPSKQCYSNANRAPRRTVILSPTAQDDGVSYLGPPQDPHDFLWLMTEEPHRSRRAAILKAHPEIKKLMGYTRTTKYVILFVVLLQLCTMYYLRNTHPFSLKFIVLAYVIGGTANHNLFVGIHEITHNLAFRSIAANKALAILANLPIAVPYAAMFKRYHMEHHRYMGEDGVDVDLPSSLELLVLNNVAGKVFFTVFQILFYALRPTFIRSQKLTPWHGYNTAVVFIFDYFVVKHLGWIPIVYFIMSSFFAGSWHPSAGHFIAEHYLWDGLDQETYSYYGPLNWVAFNVGYHNEHHDFPSVPWTRLPEVRRLAPEFYDTIASHPSWPMVIVNFIRDKEVGIFARAKRNARRLAHNAANEKGSVKVQDDAKDNGNNAKRPTVLAADMMLDDVQPDMDPDSE